MPGARGSYAKKDYAGAKAALGRVSPQSLHYHQAKYLLGVVAMKEAAPPVAPLAGVTVKRTQDGAAGRTRYAAAIEAFRQVTQLPADTAEHRHVIDFRWLAIGRLLYETDQWMQAAEAYNHVERNSPEFGTMLYELAWVYVRLGDADRALRSLEVLAIADPNSPYMADGTLAARRPHAPRRAVRQGAQLYQAARAQYDPMREKVDAFLGLDRTIPRSTTTSSRRTARRRARSSSAAADRTQWAREAEDGPRRSPSSTA